MATTLSNVVMINARKEGRGVATEGVILASVSQSTLPATLQETLATAMQTL
jgi:hypothetical protein